LTSEPRADYRLDDVGWVQFERLCDELVQLYVGTRQSEWTGRADRSRSMVVDGPLELGEQRFEGPTLVASCWVRPVASRKLTRRETLDRVVSGLFAELPDRARGMVVLTNVEGGEDSVVTLGPRALGAILDAEPTLRRRVPSVLGVRDVDALIPPGVSDASTGDVAAARDLARVFVPTRAYERTLAVLERHHFAVLTGPPEMGKTAIARMIGLALMTEGYELHECIRPDDLWSRLARDRAQVFVADDAFGSTEYRPEAAERWALDLDRILRAMDDRHWLVWTSRPAPLKAGLRRIHREHGVEHWPQPAEVHVGADELDVEEKAQILFRHVVASGEDGDAAIVVQRHGWEIVSHPHFTPERIRRFVAGRLAELAERGSGAALAAAVEAEIREPTTAMATSLRALAPEHRALLVALLDAPPGPVAERDLAHAARRHADSGLPKPPAELVDRLTDHFLRLVAPASVIWVHPSWRDLVIDELARDATARLRFVDRCTIDGLVLALSVGGGTMGERVFPLLVDDGDWDVAANRVHQLARDADDADLHRLFATLTTALDHADARTQTEVEAVAHSALEAARARWAAAPEPAPSSLLEAWADVAGRLAQPPPLPDVTRALIELLPTAPIDVTSPAELNRLDEWLRIAALVRTRAPEVAATIGFPDRFLPVLEDFASSAEVATEWDEPPSELLLQCLDTLDRVVPGMADRIAPSDVRLTGPWPAPRRTPRRPAAGPMPAQAIVTRILADLA
jgi:hypothetical protein